MKKQFSGVVFACWLIGAVAMPIGFTGCGAEGTPAPPEDVADESVFESEEYLEGERNIR